MSPEPAEPRQDPYRAPTAADSVTPGPRQRLGTWAAKVSITLAVAGLALFWGVAGMVRVMPWEYKPTGLAMSLALFMAAASHLAGFGLGWAAPRGARMLGMLANAVALLALVALIVVLAAG